LNTQTLIDEKLRRGVGSDGRNEKADGGRVEADGQSERVDHVSDKADG